MLTLSRSMLTLSRSRDSAPTPPHRLEFSSRRVAGSLLGLASFAAYGIAALFAPPGIALPLAFAALVYGVGSSAAVVGHKDGVELGAAGAVGIGLSAWVLGGLAMIEAEFWHPALLFVLLLTVSVVLHLRVLVPAWRAGTMQVVLRRALRTVDPGGRAGLSEIVGVICLVAFGYAMYKARHTRIGWNVPIGGYLGRIGTAWYVALAVMIAALTFYAWRKQAGGVLFAGLQLVVAIFGVPILVYSVPRSPAAQKHMDIIEYLIEHRQVTGIAGIYADWNGFFSGVAAALDGSGDSGDRLRLETYWPLLMALTTFAVVAALVRILGYDRLTGYLVGTVAAIANVLQQDYFSPQSVGYIIALCLFAVVLSNPRTVDGVPVPSVAPSRRHPGFEIRWWQIWYALIFGVVIGVSHQFTPFAVAGAIGVLVLWGAIRPFKRGVVLAVAVTAPIVLWALIHFDIIADFLNPSQLGNASNFSTPQTLSAPGIARLPIVAQSSLTLLATLLLVGVLAILGSVRLIRNRVTLGLGSAAIFAFSLILITPYGNEGIFRASLFALPWLIVLGLPSYRALAHGRWLMSLALAAVLGLLTAFYLVSSAGLDASNVARRADAAAYIRVSDIARAHPDTIYAVLQMGPGDLPTNLPVVPPNLNYLQPAEEIPPLPNVLTAQQYLHSKFRSAYRFLHHIGKLQKGQKFAEFILYSPASVAYAREYGQARLTQLENIRKALYIDPEQSVISVRDDTVLAQVRKGEWLRRR
jgi:hypothetical protein